MGILDNNMKKKWKKPILVSLDVKITSGSSDGSNDDLDWGLQS